MSDAGNNFKLADRPTTLAFAATGSYVVRLSLKFVSFLSYFAFLILLIFIFCVWLTE